MWHTNGLLCPYDQDLLVAATGTATVHYYRNDGVGKDGTHVFTPLQAPAPFPIDAALDNGMNADSEGAGFQCAVGGLTLTTCDADLVSLMLPIDCEVAIHVA